MTELTDARSKIERLQEELDTKLSVSRHNQQELARQAMQIERLWALIYAQHEVIKAVRSLRARGGDNPSRGTWPALHDVFDALDVLDSREPTGASE
jgi:hypothetical protein